MYSLGIDLGSTTAKAVLVEDGKMIYSKYERHFSKVQEKILEMLSEVSRITGDSPVTAAISGSAGMGIAEATGIAFVQEVFATGEVVRALVPDTSCVIELGGEDAKIIFFDGGIDERMNGSCAGGTGAFIDQMAVLLDVSNDELDQLSLQHKRIYPIASRCGVFAKSDIQPLLNQGAQKSDIAASVYQAVVNQTIVGLARGTKIKGKVMFLGGPLFYSKGLQERFVQTLKLARNDAIFPEYARFAVALGAAFHARKHDPIASVHKIIQKIETAEAQTLDSTRPPLFSDEVDYLAFKERHSKDDVKRLDISAYSGDATLGIDCGSTTTKLVLLSDHDEILYTYYSSNKGSPVQIVKEQLEKIYALCSDRIRICGSTVTGYGEELIKSAFGIDYGLVETLAHYTAAKHFNPDVDFILDIGGQDIKCFRIRNGVIDSIMLNEACSSGCGSFLETFANAMGVTTEDFAQQALYAKNSIDLGSRCTVFMNSSVKQAQKEGATQADISAGLCISVVKNAIYKVIRAGSVDELGTSIVVQGGTFMNDAVLRAFELEMGTNVVRPSIAGLMGAYGAALHAKRSSASTLITENALASFTHDTKTTSCRGCANHCLLTLNRFDGGRVYVSGNQCSKGLGKETHENLLPNLHAYKRDKLSAFTPTQKGKVRIGLPLALGMYELLPLWYTVFDQLGFDVTVSDLSTRKTYRKGQFTIPSDTACYPAKIMHGHIVELIEKGCDAIFYPSLTYNIDERASDNHFNCPLVAYYSELLAKNMDELKNVEFLYPPLDINHQRQLAKGLYMSLLKIAPNIQLKAVKAAVKAGFVQYENHMADIRRAGDEAIAFARKYGKRIMILAGRPYHIDPEIGHGIDKLANSLGFVVLSEDSAAHLSQPQKVKVLNQWTYHARLYRCADYAAKHDDVSLVQLVSFGCGVDAITTDEVSEILEAAGKYYTQIKIDEITNLGAVKIRLRSLLGALEEMPTDMQSDPSSQQEELQDITLPLYAAERGETYA